MAIRHILLISCILLLTGCAGFIKQPTSQQTANDESAIQLAEAAVSVSQSLNELAGIEKTAASASELNNLTDPSASNLPGSASIDWSGPVEPLLQKLASMSNYQVRFLGVKPAIPVVITFNAKNVPLANLLRDIDYQCGHRAKLLVYPGKKLIELRYAKS